MHRRQKWSARGIFGVLLVVSCLGILGAGGLFAGFRVSAASAYEYSTTITTSTTTITSTTTPTETKPGKGCGDKNHLHERRFECKVVISDVSKKEGNFGTTAFVLTVTVSGSPLSTITVDYSTGGGTATAGDDFNGANGTVTFAPGTTVQTVTVLVVGETARESSETFVVNLSNPTPNAYLGDSQGLGTIYNDD